MAEHCLPKEEALALLLEKPVRDLFLTAQDVQNIKYVTNQHKPHVRLSDNV